MSVILSKEQLRNRALEVDLSDESKRDDVKRIIDALRSQLEKGDKVAICAPLIGEDARIISLKFANGDIRTLINPVIELTEGSVLSRERQLFVSDDEYLIPRFAKVQLIYQTPVGKTEENAFEGQAAIVIQQMCDVLNGVLLDDTGLIILEGFDDLPKEERDNIIDMYMSSLKRRYKSSKEAIAKDSVSSTIDKAIDFSKKYMAGMIETIPLTEEEIESIRRKRGEGDVRVQSD